MIKQCTVKELIAMLQAMPQDALVEVEGCDCVGPAYKPIDQEDGTVCIIRTEAYG